MTVTFLNYQDKFGSWVKTSELNLLDQELQPMYDWCDETFGADNVGIGMLHFNSPRFRRLNDRQWQRTNRIQIYFKNEADLVFFNLKYQQYAYVN